MVGALVTCDSVSRFLFATQGTIFQLAARLENLSDFLPASASAGNNDGIGNWSDGLAGPIASVDF